MEYDDNEDDYSDEDNDYASSVDDDIEDDAEEMHDRLLAAIDNFTKQPAKSNTTKHKMGQMSLSETGGEVSLDALMNALSDSNDVKIVKKSLEDLEKTFNAPKNVEKVISNRVERSINYQNVKTDMSKWKDTITANRHVKTLDLANDKRQLKTHKELIHKFKPENEMEKEIQMVLIKSGLNEKNIEENELDELKAKQLTPQEIREKQAALAKVKALMFYEQMKRHRLNKIKSKAYHRIRKKQKLKKLQQTSTDTPMGILSDEEEVDEDGQSRQEKEEIKRIQERMNLKHKNTSRWAQMALKYGKSDASLRAAYHESVLLGQELTKKIIDTNKDGNIMEEEEDYDSDDVIDNNNNRISSTTAMKMKKIIESGGTKSTTNDSIYDETKTKYSKLFEMDFMKKAADKQQEKAILEAQEVLKELQEMEEHVEREERENDDDDDDEEESPYEKEQRLIREASERVEHEKKRKEAQEIIDSSMNMSSMLIQKKSKQKTSYTTMTPETSSTTTTTTVNNIIDSSSQQDDIALSHSNPNPWLSTDKETMKAHNKRQSQWNGHKVENEIYIQIDDKLLTSSSSSSLIANASHDTHIVEKSSTNTSKTSLKRKASNIPSDHTTSTTTTASSSQKNITGSHTTIDTTNESKDEKIESNNKKSKTDKKKTTEPKLHLLQPSQTELVQLAFSGPDYEEEFSHMKTEFIDKELGLDHKIRDGLSTVKAGWGDWTGPGQQGVSIKYLKKREGVLKRIQDETALKKATRKDIKMYHVMLSEERNKAGSKYKIGEIPHPFTSREEYERSMKMPLGAEWNASHVVRENTQPEIKIRAGRLIEPIKLPKGKKYQSAQ